MSSSTIYVNKRGEKFEIIQHNTGELFIYKINATNMSKSERILHSKSGFNIGQAEKWCEL